MKNSMKRVAVLFLLAGILGHASAASNDQIQQDIRVKFGELENLNKQVLEQLNQIKAESLKQQKALISKINEKDEQHQLQIKTLNDDLKVLETKLQDSIKAHTQTVEELNQLNKTTTQATTTINESIFTRTIAALIGLLLALGLIATSYFLLRRKQAQSTEDLSSQVKLALKNVRQTEENIVKSDIQLTDRQWHYPSFYRQDGYHLQYL